MENSWQLFLSGRVAEAYQQCEERHEDSPKSFFIRAYCLRYGFGVKKNVSEAVNNCMRVYESEDDELEPRIADMRVLTLGEIVGGALRILGSMFLGGVIGTLLLQTPIFDGYLLRDDKWIFVLSGIGVVFGCVLAFRYIRWCFPSQMKRRIQGIVASQTCSKHAVQKPLTHGRAKRFVGFLKSKTMLSVFGILLFAVGYLASSLQTGSFSYWDSKRNRSEEAFVTVLKNGVAYEFGKAVEKLSKDETYATAIELLGGVQIVSPRVNCVKTKDNKFRYVGDSVLAIFENGAVYCKMDYKFYKDFTFKVKFISLEESILDAIAEKDKDED